jgi:hypothetical protein
MRLGGMRIKEWLNGITWAIGSEGIGPTRWDSLQGPPWSSRGMKPS